MLGYATNLVILDGLKGNFIKLMLQTNMLVFFLYELFF